MKKQDTKRQNNSHLYHYGLDLRRYETIAERRIKRDDWLVIQRAKPPEVLHYCATFRGSGKYFSTIEQLNEYTRSRWGLTFTDDHKAA